MKNSIRVIGKIKQDKIIFAHKKQKLNFEDLVLVNTGDELVTVSYKEYLSLLI